MEVDFIIVGAGTVGCVLADRLSRDGRSRVRAFEGWRRGPVKPPARLEDDAAIEAFLRQVTGTTYHPCSTCPIGPVLDPALRVKGLAGLRVVDASVMPAITTANTNLPTIMIAERGADLLLADSRAP